MMKYEDYVGLREKYDPVPREVGLANQFSFLVGGVAGVFSAVSFLFVLWSFALGLEETLLDQFAFEGAPQTTATVEKVAAVDGTFLGYEQELVVYDYVVDSVLYDDRHSFTDHPPERRGDEITVEYLADDPGASRIVGGTYGLRRGVVYAPLLVGLALAGFVIYGWIDALRWGRLLRTGAFAAGELVSQQEKKKDDVVRYDLYFTFEDGAGKEHELWLNGVADPDEYSKEERELVIYDPQKPELSFLFGEVPVPMSISRPGEWDPPTAAELKKLRVLIGVNAGFGAWVLVLATQAVHAITRF